MKCPNCRCEVMNTDSICPYCNFDIYAYVRGYGKCVPAKSSPFDNSRDLSAQNDGRYARKMYDQSRYASYQPAQFPGTDERKNGDLSGKKTDTASGSLRQKENVSGFVTKLENMFNDNFRMLYIIGLINLGATAFCFILMLLLLIIK